MAILLASGNPLGLRAVGSGGRTAVSSYEQITRTLRQTLGPDHAALFAEPSQRPAAIDWYSEIEADGTPVRLTAASTDARDRGLGRLTILVADIEAKAATLQKSDRQDERILGDMLAHALDIPDEDAVFLVGGRPVMTFWGYVKDRGRPAVSPIHALMRRASPKLTPPPLAEAPERVPPPSGSPGDVQEPSGAASGRSSARLHAGVLWGLLALLVLICAIELRRGCVISLPQRLSGWFAESCLAGSDLQFADERARQADYQARYDNLIRQAALARQACPIGPHGNDDPTVDPIGDDPPAKPEPVRPIDDPSSANQQMKLPPAKTGTIDFLEGCWRAHEGLTESTAGKDTGKALKVTYCFNKDGTGSQTIRYVDDNAKCVGPLRAAWNGDSLTIDMGRAICEGSHGRYSPAVDQCRRGEDGVARCDETEKGQSKPSFSGFPFTRTSEPP